MHKPLAPAQPESWCRSSQVEAIRLFIADEQSMFRCGIAAVVARERSFAAVGEAATGAEAVHSAPAVQPDVVLVSLQLGQAAAPGAGSGTGTGPDGIGVIQALRAALPLARFVALTATPDGAEVRRAIAAGAMCFLLKSATAQELITVLQAAHRGQHVYAPEVTQALAASDRSAAVGADLTQRERMLLALMAHGLPNQEISVRLDIAMPTVKFHITNILAKLHADNRTAAVLTALRHRIVSLA